MTSLRRIAEFLQNEDGPTAVEYAVMLGLIIIVCISAVQAVAVYPKTQFSTMANSLAGS